MSNIDYVLLSHQIVAERQFTALSGDLSLSLLPGGQQNKIFYKQFTDAKAKYPLSYINEIGTYRNLSMGSITNTSYPIDFAIVGNGYFKVLTPDGIRYGRNGRCHLGPNGEVMVGKNGYLLKEDDTPLQIPPNKTINDLQVASNLTISIGEDFLGKLGVVRFKNEQKMNFMKNYNLYETDQEPLTAIDENGELLVQVQQGAYESANVSASTVLIEYMQFHRNFQAVDEFIKKHHQAELKTIDSWLKVTA